MLGTVQKYLMGKFFFWPKSMFSILILEVSIYFTTYQLQFNKAPLQQELFKAIPGDLWKSPILCFNQSTKNWRGANF